MIADLDTPELEELLTRSLAADLSPEGRGRIRARLDAAPERRHGLLARRRRTVVTVGLAAALLVAGTAGAAQIIREWGPVDHPATIAELDAEISAAVADNTLPPGYSYPLAQIRAAAEKDGGRAKNGGTLSVQQHYMCAWTDYWLAANKTGDAQRQAAALSKVEAFPKLMLIVDQRFADDSIRDEIAQVVAGAKAGDAAPVQELWGAACSDAMVVRP